MKYTYHQDDIPKSLEAHLSEGDLAVDTEAMGLNNHRDRLCVAQLSDGSGVVHVVHFKNQDFSAPNLKKLLLSEKQKIFHFARFDVAILQKFLNIEISNIYCTKIASKVARTYSSNHSLSDLCYELLKIKISKQQQSSDWGAEILSKEQLVYAATDVLYLHKLRDILNKMLTRENRLWLAQKCFGFIPTRAHLDILGWLEHDIFSHHN